MSIITALLGFVIIPAIMIFLIVKLKDGCVPCIHVASVGIVLMIITLSDIQKSKDLRVDNVIAVNNRTIFFEDNKGQIKSHRLSLNGAGYSTWIFYDLDKSQKGYVKWSQLPSACGDVVIHLPRKEN